jgi:hypothetical protein
MFDFVDRHHFAGGLVAAAFASKAQAARTIRLGVTSSLPGMVAVA